MTPRPVGPWSMDPRGQQLPLPGTPHPPAPAALSPPGAYCFLPLCLLLPCPLPTSLLHLLSLALLLLFFSFSPFSIFSAFYFCSFMSLFLLFSCFLHFPIFLSFLFLSSFSFPFFLTLFITLFLLPSIFLFFSFPFFHLFPFVSLFPFRFPSPLCFLSPGRRRVAPAAAGEDGARGLWQPWSTRSTRSGGPWSHSPQLPAWEPAQLSLIPGGRSNGLSVQGDKKWGACERLGGLGVEALQSPLFWGDTRVQGLRMLNLHFASPHKDHLGPSASPLTVPQHPQTLCRVRSEVGPGTGGLAQTPQAKQLISAGGWRKAQPPGPPLYIAPATLLSVASQPLSPPP